VNRRAKVAGGSIYYTVQGTGPALLLMGGGPGNADTLEPLASRLAQDHTVVTYDRRGYSRSQVDDPAQPAGIPGHSDDARQLIADLGSGPVSVFGTSFGALVALDLAATAPDAIGLLIVHEPPLGQMPAGRSRSPRSDGGGQSNAESGRTWQQSVLLQHAGSARGRAETLVAKVQVEPDPAAGPQIGGVPGGVQLLAGPPAGGQTEDRVAVDQQCAAVVGTEPSPAHVSAVAVLLRVHVRGLHLVDGERVVTDACGLLAVGIGLAGAGAEPLNTVEPGGDGEPHAQPG
jgi:pimeloyl-ACP methyl ester carboxylesterase